MPILNIFRGLPGSGKTTKANQTETLVLSPADMYSMVDGKYSWSPENQEISNNWAVEIFHFSLLHDIDITIAEVLPTIESVKKYTDLALEYNYKINVVDCKIDTDLSHQRNIHDVPMEHIKEMSKLWQDWDNKYLGESYE